MKVTQAAPCYRPVTIVLETQEDYHAFFWIVSQVAENCSTHPTQVIAEARKLLNALERAE